MGMIKRWLRNSSSGKNETIFLGRSYTQGHKKEDSKPKWQTFWRRIGRDKMKVFNASATFVQASYDPDEYIQNFDQGTGRTEPDNLCRSFSARFADPLRISQKTNSVRFGRHHHEGDLIEP
uniref:Uncharacterized protein n=1 Tax=Rhizophora mucronata TaxID=61149 RepID=A0A2P2PN12_RHIMU